MSHIVQLQSSEYSHTCILLSLRHGLGGGIGSGCGILEAWTEKQARVNKLTLYYTLDIPNYFTLNIKTNLNYSSKHESVRLNKFWGIPHPISFE